MKYYMKKYAYQKFIGLYKLIYNDNLK